MKIKGLNVGDIKGWATKVLHDELETIVNSKSSYSLPYYIVITMKEGYDGPAAYGNNNELLHGDDKKTKPRRGKTKTVNMEGQRVMTQRFILVNKPPLIPLVGSAVVYVNNKTGEVKFLYILPPDKPMIGGFDVELESEAVLRAEKGMPIVYGKAN